EGAGGGHRGSGGGVGLWVVRRSVGERQGGAGRGRAPQVALPLRQRVLIDEVSGHAAAGGEPRRSGAGHVEPVDVGLLPDGGATGRVGSPSRRAGRPPPPPPAPPPLPPRPP